MPNNAQKKRSKLCSARTTSCFDERMIFNLLDLLEDNGLSVPPQSDWLDELNPYAVEARYGTIEPSGLDRQRALAAAGQALEWAVRETAKINFD